MAEDDAEIQEALQLIDETILELVPQYEIDQTQITHISGAASVGNAGHGFQIGGPSASADVDSSGHSYQAIQDLAEVAQLIEEGPEENKNTIMRKLESIDSLLGPVDKAARIASLLPPLVL